MPAGIGAPRMVCRVRGGSGGSPAPCGQFACGALQAGCALVGGRRYGPKAAERSVCSAPGRRAEGTSLIGSGGSRLGPHDPKGVFLRFWAAVFRSDCGTGGRLGLRASCCVLPSGRFRRGGTRRWACSLRSAAASGGSCARPACVPRGRLRAAGLRQRRKSSAVALWGWRLRAAGPKADLGPRRAVLDSAAGLSDHHVVHLLGVGASERPCQVRQLGLSDALLCGCIPSPIKPQIPRGGPRVPRRQAGLVAGRRPLAPAATRWFPGSARFSGGFAAACAGATDVSLSSPH